MLKKKVTYKDFDEVEQTEELHFHMTKAELVEFVSQYPDDFTAYIKKISAMENKQVLVEMFKTLILKSYGVREGSVFKKSPEMAENFSHTEAYSALFIDIFTNTDSMIAFFNGVLGVDVEKFVAEANLKLN